jgi:hypothetical protein
MTTSEDLPSEYYAARSNFLGKCHFIKLRENSASSKKTISHLERIDEYDLGIQPSLRNADDFDRNANNFPDYRVSAKLHWKWLCAGKINPSILSVHSRENGVGSAAINHCRHYRPAVPTNQNNVTQRNVPMRETSWTYSIMKLRAFHCSLHNFA